LAAVALWNNGQGGRTIVRQKRQKEALALRNITTETPLLTTASPHRMAILTDIALPFASIAGKGFLTAIEADLN